MYGESLAALLVLGHWKFLVRYWIFLQRRAEFRMYPNLQKIRDTTPQGGATNCHLEYVVPPSGRVDLSKRQAKA